MSGTVNVEGDYYILDIYCQQLWNVVHLRGFLCALRAQGWRMYILNVGGGECRILHGGVVSVRGGESPILHWGW